MKRTPFDRFIDWIDRNPRWATGWFLLLLLIVFFGLPILLTKISLWVSFDASTGVIGDTIGGITGPLIGLFAAVLTFFAFWIQFKANQQQRIDIRIERFENKFFEMLKLHKENVNEMVIEGYDVGKLIKRTGDGTGQAVHRKELNGEIVPKLTEGRKVFVAATTELKAIHEICALTLNFETITDKPDYLIKLSYRLFFNGIESPAVKNIDSNVPGDEAFVEKCKEQLMKARRIHEDSGGVDKEYAFPQSNKKVSLNFKYKPFSGHASRFGHYYRHLFLMVKFVANRPETDQFGEPEKREYLRMLRAQLSKHEQLMLYFNYLSGYGARWEDDTNAYFSRYRMIHNLPIELTEFTISPYITFKRQIDVIKQTGEHMFEYDE